MAGYRQIHTKIWKDEWFIELEIQEKLLFIYLFSNDLASIGGLYKIPLRVIANETGLDREFIADALERFGQADKVHYKDGVVWVVNMDRYHANASYTTQKKVSNDVAQIPDGALKTQYLSSIDTPSIPHQYGRDALTENEVKAKAKAKAKAESESKSKAKAKGESTSSAILQFNDQTARGCEYLYQKVTGQITIPADQRSNAMEDLEAIQSHYGNDHERAVQEGGVVFQRWCSSKGKSGRPYSRINVGWLSWWLDGIAPIPATLPVISIPSPNILCGDGERYKRQAENHQGNSRFAEALSEYKTHLETCAVCGRGSNVVEVKASIESLVGKWTK